MEGFPLLKDTAEVAAQVRLKRANQEWLDKHRAELRKQFPDRYVAVLNKRVVASSKDFPELLSRLRKQFPDENPSLAAIELIGRDEFVWVL